MLQSLLTPRPVSRGRTPSFVVREQQNINTIKEEYIKSLQFAFLESFSPSLRQRLIARSEIFQLPAGDLVYRAGEKNSSCFFVLLGQLLVFAEGSSRPLLEISAGTSFGHGAAFSGERRHVATVVAKSSAVLARLDFSEFNSAASETPDNNFRFLRRMIGNIKPFSSLAEKDFTRLFPITKIAKIGQGQKFSATDKIAILCEGEIHGFAGDEFPIFFCDQQFLIPCGVLDEIRVQSTTATFCLIAWSDFRKLLVSDLSGFYDALVRAMQLRASAVRAKWSHARLRPDFEYKRNQVISDLTMYVREISRIPDTPDVAHAAWVSALRRIETARVPDLGDAAMHSSGVHSTTFISSFFYYVLLFDAATPRH